MVCAEPNVVESPPSQADPLAKIHQRAALQQQGGGGVSLPSMVTSLAALTAPELELREQVRAFLVETLPWGTFEPGLGMGAGVNPAFSGALAERGWVGMAVPAHYGGRDATAVDRFVVVEELLRWGAPVGHHWVADRQIAPVLLRYGTEEQKRWLLPRICRGELCFCIGMSEPDAGSDLASVRTRGVRDGDGWRVSGVKVWTSNAMRADFMIALCRTGEGARHVGLSRFLIHMRSPGVTVKPIPYLNGSTDHFAEVVLDGVLVSDEMVIGEIGQGWAQNANELAFRAQRPGPVDLNVPARSGVHPRVAGPGRQSCREPADRRTRGPVLGAAPALACRGQGDRRRRHTRGRGGAHQGDGHPVRTGCRERAAGVVGP